MLQIFVDVCYDINGWVGGWDKERERGGRGIEERLREEKGQCATDLCRCV